MPRWLPVLFACACYASPDLPVETDLQLVPANKCEQDRSAFVTCVLDGDTFDVDGCGEDVGERIRMLGVDAPEVEHPPEPADCYGDNAHAELIELLEGQRVTLTFDAECTGVFGRTLAYVWLTGSSYDRIAALPEVEDYVRNIPGDPDPALLLNEWMIAQGYAEVFPEEAFGRITFQDELERAEADAKSASRGLWGSCSVR